MKPAVRCAAIALLVFAVAAPSVAQTPAQAPPAPVNPNGPTLCNAPAPPPLYLPAALPPAPVPPKCVNVEKNTDTCSPMVFNKWAVDQNAYGDIKRKRVAEMNAYNRELQKYQNAATQYAMCEQSRVSELLPE
jgi:hypothetical protein